MALLLSSVVHEDDIDRMEDESSVFADDTSDDEDDGRIPTSVLLSDLDLGLHKASRPMLESLHDLRCALLCPLCQSVFQSPMTGPCGHSFCHLCIDAHSCHHSECPVDGCSIPLSMSSRGKSFRQVNPALETAVTSFRNIVHALRNANDQWWDVVPVDDDDLCDHNNPTSAGMTFDEEEEEEEEMIDLNDMPSPGRPSFGASSSGPGSPSDDDNEE